MIYLNTSIHARFLFPPSPCTFTNRNGNGEVKISLIYYLLFLIKRQVWKYIQKKLTFQQNDDLYKLRRVDIPSLVELRSMVVLSRLQFVPRPFQVQPRHSWSQPTLPLQLELVHQKVEQFLNTKKHNMKKQMLNQMKDKL